MKSYEAYLHTSGTLMVIKIEDWSRGMDIKSPYVHKYLGRKMLPSLNQAKKYFREQNGGRTYIDLSGIKKK